MKASADSVYNAIRDEVRDIVAALEAVQAKDIEVEVEVILDDAFINPAPKPINARKTRIVARGK